MVKASRMASANTDVYDYDSVLSIRHIYKAVWGQLIDETLHFGAEDTNEHNKYSITITMYCYNSIL